MIDKKNSFYGLMDFFEKKESIKENYLAMNKEEKIIYKMYVYSLCFENEYTKDLIWEYLNGYAESLADLCKEYRIQKKRLERRQKVEIYDIQENG
jgi:hypothetical protein